MSNIAGVFCISLDFEKYWGTHDVVAIHECPHLKKVDKIVTGMLTLFKRYDTHVSWAFVGLLGYESATELKLFRDLQRIPYSNVAYSPFPVSKEKYGDLEDKILCAKKALIAIKEIPYQELASHTYSHFYFLESGVQLSDFQLDIDRMNKVATELGIHLKSIVFPRNQVHTEALKLLSAKGFTAYRGNQENRYWSNGTYENESTLKKIMRVLDAYLRVSKTTSYKLSQLKVVSGLVNIPANRFLRPPSARLWLEKRKIKRVKNEMHRAAKRGTVYHLWWHPHNFAHEPEIALNQLEEILAYYHVLQKRYHFENLNMNEISNRVKA